MLKLIKEDPISTSYLTDVDTYIIPNVNEEDSEHIINFAYRSDNVQNCEWNNGQIEIECDPFTFQMLLLWTYRKGFVMTDRRIRDILIDNGITESVRPERRRNLKEQNVDIEVKNKGILEVPEGKNVDDLPMSHFEKLVKKHGLSKITKALNNLQVWNKNDDKKLSKWAGNMIDKLTKKYGKNESMKYRRRYMKESPSKSYWKYSVLDPVFDRDEDDDTYLSKYDIRRVKLIPCDNPDECYDDVYSAVCNYEYPYDEFYGTKQDAYDMLLTSWNNSTFERIHDI